MYGIVLATMLTTGGAAPDYYVGGYCGWYGYCGYGYCGYAWPGYSYWGYPAYYYPAYYSYPAYYYPAPVFVASAGSVAPTTPRALAQAPRSEPASVVIRAAADLTVTVNGRAIERSSPEELFLTPDLSAGKSYVYRISTSREGRTVGERQVTVRAGQRTLVDLNERAGPRRTDVARISVLGPGAARLIVNEREMGTVEARRSFETPSLQPGRRYFYTVRVELEDGGRTRTATRRVAIEANADVTVDFSDLAPAARAER